jgi:hypothetical protein
MTRTQDAANLHCYHTVKTGRINIGNQHHKKELGPTVSGDTAIMQQLKK